MSKKKYINYIKNCDVFICPRKQGELVEFFRGHFMENILYHTKIQLWTNI